MIAYCRHCGHTENAHTRTDDDGHTEPSPCQGCSRGRRCFDYSPAPAPSVRDENGRCRYCKRSWGMTHVQGCPGSIRRLRSGTCPYCGEKKTAGFPLCRGCALRHDLGLPRSWPRYYSEEEQDRVDAELHRGDFCCEHCGRREPLHEPDCEGLVQDLDLAEEYHTRGAR